MRFDRELIGDGMFLRQMEPADISADFIRWLHDSEVNRFLDVRHNPPDHQQQVEYVERCLASTEKFYLGVFLSESRLIGSSTINTYGVNKAEVGLMIGDKSSHGKGFGTQVVQLIIQWARVNGFEELTAGYSPDNIASAKLFARMGFAINKEGKNSGIVVHDQGAVRTSLLLRA